MNLSLGNMLGKRMAINPDGLSLDLAFAADKTLTARKGPTPTFTRASTATFVGSDGLIQSSSINNARFDHDPVTLASKGLLIEESRTNLTIQSQEFDNAAYSKAAIGVAAATITANNDTAPDGTLTADLVNFSATTAIDQQGQLFRNVVTATAGQNITLSIYMRVPSGTATVFIGLTELSPLTGQSVACNVTTTWQRFSITRTALATTSMFLQIGPVTSAFMGQPAVQPAASVLLWGAQFEVGAFPTSYIPTTTVALTRSADACSVTTAGWSNAGNDTMLAEYFVSTATSGAIIVEGSPAISWMSLSFSSTNRQRNIYRHGGTSTRFDATTANNSVSLININKVALTSGEQLALNGSLTQTVASEPPQTDISTSLSIGSRGNGSSVFLNGHIARIKYFRKRLPNAKLQTITT